jgi:Spy/CpxP family protein refolding chaperone
MKMQFLTVAAVALMAAPMLHAQQTAAPATASAQARAGRGHGRMMADLGLSADQQARIKAIHTKYGSQMKAARGTSKPDLDAMKAARANHDTAAMRAARAKLRADMGPSMNVRKQEMTEMRSVLTPAQQQKFDAQRAQMKAKAKGAKGTRGWKHNRPANSTQPARAGSGTL